MGLEKSSSLLLFFVVIKFDNINGKLRHLSVAVPEGRGMFSPFNKAIPNQYTQICLPKTVNLRNAIHYWLELIKKIRIKPTHFKELVPVEP